MRYDIKVFWIEDTPSWGDTSKELLELTMSELGIYVEFILESDAKKAEELLRNSCIGFKKFDLLFIDYNISSLEYDGAKLIQALRNNDIDVDVLFYSADREREIKGLVAQNLSAYEGVYIANRETFKEKATALIEKNTRRQLSIKNIRGMLMDNTSENDFIVKSLVLEKYEKLDMNQKKELINLVIAFLKKEVEPRAVSIKEFVEDIEANGIKNIQKFLDKPNYMVSLELKYILFKYIIEALSISRFDIVNYQERVVDKRNVLAHKKLEICDDLSHIKYCDTLKQYKARRCTTDCSKCTSTHMISLEEWNDIRKDTIMYSNILDEILKSI